MPIRTVLLASVVALAPFSVLASEAEVQPLYMDARLLEDLDKSGPYLGAKLSSGETELSFGGFTGTEDFNSFGLVGGYRFDTGNIIYGGEISFNRLNFDVGDNANLIDIRGTVGYDFGRVVPYVGLGLAYLDIDNGSGTESGISYGIGVDYYINERVAIGAEYTCYDFNDLGGTPGFDANTEVFSIRTTFRF